MAEVKSKASIKSAYQFLEHIKDEFHKIQWTDGEEIWVYAKVVVGATFVLGLAIYLADVIIHNCLLLSQTVFQWIFG